MATLPKLQSNGRYWVAAWRDSSGKRRYACLGAKARVGRKDAQRAVDALVRSHSVIPGAGDSGKAPTLLHFLKTAWAEGENSEACYFARRTDLDASTIALHKTTAEYLLDHFAHGVRLDKITRNQASLWRDWLTGRTFVRGGEGAKRYPLSEATVRRHVATAKQIFKWAADRDIIAFSPFDREKIGAAPAQEDWRYVSLDELDRIVEACPSVSWKVAFALARLAGLRINEISRAELGWVDHERRVIRVVPKERKGRRRRSTKQTFRTVPLSPTLYALVLAAHEAAADGQRLLCPDLSTDSHAALKIITAAGIEAYSKPMHSLRKSLETDWLIEHPLMQVCLWLGNSPEVAQKHYNQIRPDVLKRVTDARNKSRNKTPKTQRGRRDSNPRPAV